MGTCLMCHRKIRDGQKYCDSCKQKRKKKADESYLDSLLSSVGGNQTEDKGSSGQKGKSFPAYTDNNSLAKGKGIKERNLAQEPKVQAKDYVQEPVVPETDYAQGPTNPATDYTTEPQPDNGEMDDMLSDILSDMDAAGIDGQQPESDIQEEDIENIFDEAEAYATLLSKDENITDVSNFVEPDNGGATEDQPPIQENVEDSGQAGIGMEGASQDAQQEPDDLDLGDDGFNEMDEIILNESILGENAEMNSVQDAYSDFDPLEEEIEAESKPKKKKKKKLSWFKRLFGNVNDEITPEMIEANNKKKAEKEEEEKQKKAEKKKKEEEKLAQIQAEKERKKAEADAERNRKLALAMEKKNAAKEKQRQKREQALAIAEYELEHGKINKAGATILFVIFAILTIVIIIGTNIYSYNLSLQNAREDFAVKKYNEAYYEVYGYDLKIKESGIEDDILLYDKIMTVMYVKSQLNSYEYYMTSNNRGKALDSLLKGLQKYDKYLRLAKELNIQSDLDYVKQEILEKLESEFNLGEQDAELLVEKLDPVDYSEYLYGLIGDYEEELEKYRYSEG